VQTIGGMLDSAAHYDPERIAVVFAQDHVTYRDLNAEVNRIAHGLQMRGVRQGDRVMVLMPNSLQLLIVYHGIIRLGATVVPLNVMYRAHEIRHIGQDTAARALIADAELWKKESSVLEDLPALETIFSLDRHERTGHLMLDPIRSVTASTPPFAAALDDIASIIYTSGTTGRPKGATQTHRSILSNVQGCCTRNKFSRDDRLLCALPLFNNFAINVVMMSAFATGATLVVVDRFEARRVLDHISEHRGTYFAGTPTMFSYLLQEFDPGKDDVRSLRVTNSGGAHCPGEVVRQVEKVLGSVHMDGYGQTEGCGFTTLNPLLGIRKENSVGLPISNIWVKIVDDGDRELPSGEVGEIAEKGDAFSIHGYWNRPDANAETYRNGWFHSGDLGYVDEDGYLFVVDRKQDLIITGGANIYPAEVEEVLYTHPKVALAAVIGVPDPVKGELAKAFIVLKKGEIAEKEEIIDYVRERIAKYKAPRMLEFLDSLPQGPTGKILKRELRTAGPKTGQ
jgi:long-chain acyl-CoA synthetase